MYLVFGNWRVKSEFVGLQNLQFDFILEITMSKQKFETEPIWTPNENSGRRMKEFMTFIEKNHDLKFGDYREFHKWSVENLDVLWAEIWFYSGVISSKPFDQVIDRSISMEDRPKWFEGAQLNLAENLLKFRDDHVALLLTGEDSDVERLTYKELYENCRLYAAAFRKMGLKKGDIVTCYMSNRKEPIIAMLATTSIGAIWTGVLPLYGAQTYINAVKQVQPKILLTVDQFTFKKETNHLLENIKEIAEGLTSIEKVIIVPSKPASKLKDITGIKNSIFLDDFLKTGYNADGTVPEIIFEQVSFSHPVSILYTSGTTGLPKPIVHGFGGILSCIRDFWLHLGIERNDIWLSIEMVGWGTWNMLNSMLFIGATLIIFEGEPNTYSPTYLWDMIDNLKVSALLLTPATLDEIEAKGYIPNEKHNLKSLKMIVSGTSIVKPRNLEFGLMKIKPGLIVTDMYGSTETMGITLLTDHTLPQYKKEISTPCLGVGIECLDEGGKPVIGERGELAYTTPLPSLPVFLWGDYDGTKYKEAYFSKYAGKFVINDIAIINPVTKGVIICGRSDETLRVKEYCFGSSEIYNIVTLIPDIRDSLCTSQFSKNMDQRVVLFVKMNDGIPFTPELQKRLQEMIARELTIDHVPNIMLEVPDIPYNANGKKMEIIVKKIINNYPHYAETVKNSECLKYYYNVPELQGF